MHLLNGAHFVDGGGRGYNAMKARAEGDCFLVSVARLAFGGRCTSVGQVEAYALPVRAAMVYNAIANFEQFVAKKGCYRKVAFYDADVAEVVFALWDAEGVNLSPDQVRVALLFTGSVCKVGVPCPIACAPLLADVLGLGLRIYHPGERSTCCGRAWRGRFASFPISMATRAAFCHTGTVVLIMLLGEYHKEHHK